jgi:hypothetical protein
MVSVNAIYGIRHFATQKAVGEGLIAGSAVFVRVRVFDFVGVLVRFFTVVLVGVLVRVAVRVFVGVFVGVFVRVAVLAVADGIGVADAVGVPVASGNGVALGVVLATAVGTGVLVGATLCPSHVPPLPSELVPSGQVVLPHKLPEMVAPVIFAPEKFVPLRSAHVIVALLKSAFVKSA